MARLVFVVFVLLFLSIPALANSVASVTIGTLTYLGPNSEGASQYQIDLDSHDVTAEPFMSIVAVIGNDLGAESIEIPTTAGFNLVITRGFNNCPCTSISLSLVISYDTSQKVTVLLANGKSFTAFAVDTSTILPLQGQSFIEPGQSVPIELTAVPESGTALLLGIGLAGLLVRPRRLLGLCN